MVVSVATTTSLDLELTVGQTSEAITVTAETPLVQRDSSELSTGVAPQTYMDLPINASLGQSASGGRSAAAFIFLAPGVVGTASFGGAYVNGTPRFSRDIQVDGLSLTTTEVGGDERQLSYAPEAIQEFSITGTGYPAEFGNTGGAVERYTVRSGTNRYHGNLYEFLRNDKLDARGFFNKTRSVNRQNEFGGSLGGPVTIPKLYSGRDKTFFFFNANLFRFVAGPANSLGSVPTEAFRRGDLSAWPLKIYDPATTRPDDAGGFTRDPFPGNVIPPSRLSPVTQKILSYVPAPNLPGVTNNYLSSFRNQVSRESYTTRIDHSLTDNQRLSLSYNFGAVSDNGSCCGFVLPNPLEYVRYGVRNPVNHNGRVSWDWSIRPTMLNHFAVGITRQDQLARAPEDGQNWGDKLGIGGLPNGAFPTLNFNPYTSVANLQGLLATISTSYLFADSFTVIHGRHTIKTGFDFRKLQNNFYTGSYTGTFTFSPNETALPTPAGRATSGDAFASMLLGLVDTGSITYSTIVRGLRVPYFAAYVQDDIKVSRSLTVNLGLRWDLDPPFREVNNFFSIMDPSVPNPGAGGRPGALIFAGTGPGRIGREHLVNRIDYKNFGPRLGFAWSVTPRIVLRSAYGISYYPTGALGGGNTKPVALGFEANPTYSSQDLGLTPGLVWDRGFPTDWRKPPFIDPAFGLNSNVSAYGPLAYKASYTQAWNFGIQYELGRGWLLDTSYVGNKGTRFPFGANPNQVDPKYLSLGDLLVHSINDPAVTAQGFTAPYPGFSGTLAQALRPFPQYKMVSLGSTALDGFTTYHSLQIKTQKRLASGLFFLATYVWSKTLSNVNATTGGGVTARDYYNRSLEKALATYDVPSRLVVAFTYELPFGPNKTLKNWRGVAGKLVGGWQLNGVCTYQSGTPITISAANTLPLFNSRNLPNAVPGVNPLLPLDHFDPAKNLAFNINAFSIPAPYTFGNASPVLPNARTFPTYNENLGLIKRTWFGEQWNLEFRFELFNSFNRVVFGPPASNVSDPVNFGKVTSQANSPRQGQFALKLNF